MCCLLRTVIGTSLLIFATSFAQAQAVLTLSTNGNTLVVADGLGAGATVGGLTTTVADINPAPGIVSPGFQTLGNFIINPATTGTTSPPLGSATEAIIDLLLNVSSTGAGTLTAMFGDTNFTLAEDLVGTLEASVGGFTTGSTLDYSASHDPGNVLFGTTDTVPLTGLGAGAFNDSGSTDVTPQTDPFSLKINAEITHTGAQTTAFNGTASVAYTPEPTSFTIWTAVGSVLIGIRMARRRRARQRTHDA